jgi:hypothetical protein
MGKHGDERQRVYAYRPPWRLVVATLATLGGASLPAILLLVLLANDPPVTPPVLVRLISVFTLPPALAAWAVARALAAGAEVRGTELVVSGRGFRAEIPCASIARVRPWAVPLPGPGLSLEMRSGRRFRYGLQTSDPAPLLAALADVGGVETARGAARHPVIVYAHAKHELARRRWYGLAGKFGLFALVPTAVLFNAHQHIAYGGLLGEYHLLGPASYLRTFAVHWLTASIYLVLYASLWRGLAEGVALAAAAAAPSRAARVRRTVEAACRVLYYGGVPVLLGLRFLPW